MRLERVAELLHAEPRGTALRWYVADCPECGTERALAITTWGAECRWGGCNWRTSDHRRVVARWLAIAGWSQGRIAAALRGLAA